MRRRKKRASEIRIKELKQNDALVHHRVESLSTPMHLCWKYLRTSADKKPASMIAVEKKAVELQLIQLACRVIK